MKKILKPTHGKRIIFFVIFDIIFIVISLYIAFLFRFDLKFPYHYTDLFKKLIFLFLIIKIPIFWFFNLYNFTWRYVGLYDFFNIVKASFVSTTTIGIIIYFLKHPYFEGTPRSIIVIDFFISLFLISLIRVSKRFLSEFIHIKKEQKQGVPTVIIGAGNTGEMIVRDLIRGDTQYNPICFLDNDPSLFGSQIHGIPVFPMDDLPVLVFRHNIKAAIVAIPSIDTHNLQKIYKMLNENKVKDIKIIPALYRKVKINVKNLEDIKIEDLLGRQEIKIDTASIELFLRDKKVLVTGASGSIGKEIVKQVEIKLKRRLKIK